jgi:hypothetical protein
MGGGPARERRASHLRLLVGQLVQGVAHRGGRFVTVGGDTVADRAALQGDEPPVDAAPARVDPDGVAAVAGRPELVAAFSLDSYCTIAGAGGSGAMKAMDRRTDGAVAILPAFCQNYPHRPVRARIKLDDQSRVQPAEQGERGAGGSSRTVPDEANPAETQGRRFDPVPAHQKGSAQRLCAETLPAGRSSRLRHR